MKKLSFFHTPFEKAGETLLSHLSGTFFIYLFNYNALIRSNAATVFS